MTRFNARQAPLMRWEQFSVYENGDGTFHILLVDSDGGYIFADRFNDKAQAEWACALFNAAIGLPSNPADDEGTT